MDKGRQHTCGETMRWTREDSTPVGEGDGQGKTAHLWGDNEMDKE